MAMLLSLGRAFPALAEPRMRRYLSAQAASLLGSWVLDITLNLLVWRLTQSPAMLGALNFLIYLPSLVVTPLLSGRLRVDNARRLSLAVLAAAMAVAVGLTLGHALGLLTLPVLLGAALVRGVLGGMEVPSRQMLLMSLTHDSARLASAIALNTVVFLLARTLGPALAGLMFEPLGPGAGFVLAALGTAVMWRNVWRLPRPSPVLQAPTPAQGGGLGAALRFVWQDGFGRLFLPMTACVAFCAGAYQTLVPVLADRVYGSASAWTGWFFGASGVGALVAAVLLSSRHVEASLRRGLMAVPWLAVLALALLAVSAHVATTLAGFALLGFCTSFVGTGTNATLHRRVPPAARGGLIALLLLAFNGVMPLAQLVAGALAQWGSVNAAFGWLAAGLAVVLAVAYGWRWRRLGRVVWDMNRL
jgi:MFS family permease